MASTRKATSKRSAATKTKKAASSKRPATKTKSVSKATKKPISTKKKQTGKQVESKNVKFLPKLPTSVTLRSRLSLIALSPYRFPLDIDRLAIQSARLAGVSFVLVGAMFTFITAKQFINQLDPEIASTDQRAATYESVKQMSSDDTSAFSFTNKTFDFTVSSLSENGDRLVELKTVLDSAQVVLMVIDLDSGESKRVGNMRILSRDGQVTKWVSIWRTNKFAPGRYRLSVEVTKKNEGDFYRNYVLTDSNTYSIDGNTNLESIEGSSVTE